jgi:hypothetical protein
VKANWYLIIALTFVAHLTSCNEAPMSSKNNSAQLDGKEIDSAIKTVGNMRIFFGHQSVGKNILDGINDISKKTNHKVNLVKSREVIENTEAAFFHANVGKNQDPLSKIADFRELFENGMGGKVDVAFLKFCYVDFDGGTDIQSIFQQYRQTMESLKKNYPQTTFVHFSVPLVNARLGIKDYIKKIIGKHNTKIEGNIKRNQFNEMLRAEYEGKEPIFDLAGIESTYPDGKNETFEKDGRTYYALAPLYTNDGSHLNKTGRKVVASKLLYFLASI